jgi:hypothetical protein
MYPLVNSTITFAKKFYYYLLFRTQAQDLVLAFANY